MLVDSHCHLDFPDFFDDFPDILAHAKAAGIGHMVTICTQVTKFDEVLAIATAHDNIFCSVGIHPHEAESEPFVSADRLIDLAEHPKVVGIGETGLDYFYENSPKAAQKACFRAHIAAARQSGLPLIVHTRSADAETVEILREETAEGGFPGVIHCFSVGKAVAEAALEFGLYISLSGIVTFRNAAGLRDIVKDLPLDRILVETDAPYLAPEPHRGQRNEPAFVAATAVRVADILDISLEELTERTTENFFRLFSKAKPVGAS